MRSTFDRRYGPGKVPDEGCKVFGHLVHALAVVPHRYHSVIFSELARHMTWRAAVQGDAQRIMRMLLSHMGVDIAQLIIMRRGE